MPRVNGISSLTFRCRCERELSIGGRKAIESARAIQLAIPRVRIHSRHRVSNRRFTDRTSHQTRSQIADLLERHKSVVLPVLEAKGGKLVKTIGDAFLMTFDSPTDAVLAGTAVQDALRAHNEGRTEDDRIG